MMREIPRGSKTIFEEAYERGMGVGTEVSSAQVLNEDKVCLTSLIVGRISIASQRKEDL